LHVVRLLRRCRVFELSTTRSISRPSNLALRDTAAVTRPAPGAGGSCFSRVSRRSTTSGGLSKKLWIASRESDRLAPEELTDVEHIFSVNSMKDCPPRPLLHRVDDVVTSAGLKPGVEDRDGFTLRQYAVDAAGRVSAHHYRPDASKVPRSVIIFSAFGRSP
jgi:hypothetical protein